MLCTAFFAHSAPGGAPENFTNTTTGSRSITVEWSSVPCIDRNSEITGYALRYGEVSDTEREQISIDGELETYTITGLVPYTNYTVKVTAVNSDGQIGPFAVITSVETLQDSKLTKATTMHGT